MMALSLEQFQILHCTNNHQMHNDGYWCSGEFQMVKFSAYSICCGSYKHDTYTHDFVDSFRWFFVGVICVKLVFKACLIIFLWLQNSPCNACCVHCCFHWCALCQEHREMNGRLSDNIFSEMTVVNPPPVQEMKSTDDKETPETSSPNNIEHTELEIEAV